MYSFDLAMHQPTWACVCIVTNIVTNLVRNLCHKNIYYLFAELSVMSPKILDKLILMSRGCNSLRDCADLMNANVNATTEDVEKGPVDFEGNSRSDSIDSGNVQPTDKEEV